MHARATIASDAPALDGELTQGFDAAGRRTLLGAEVNNAGDLQDRFFYDNLGRVTKIERDSAPEFRVDLAYDAAGQFTSIKRYKDLDGGAANLVVETTYAYDGIGRLTDLTHFKDTTTFADYGWTYDAFSRVTQFSFSHLVGGSGASAYTYDNTSQVTGADHTNQTDEAYTYDSAGNRTVSGYTTGANNRLTSDGTYTYAYDDEGNRVTRTHTSSGQVDEYAYDHRNRMTGVTTRATSGGAILQTVAYTYDVWDRRIEKTVDADGAGSGVAVITRWAYDGQNILLTVDATGLVTHRYLYGPDGQVLADDYIGAEKYFPLADNLGSVRDILDHAGAVRNHIDYNAFGKVTNETTAAFDFLFGYTGFERDEETGLLHSDTRYYDAVHARWTQEDWDVFRAGDYNLNRYVGNKATNWVDPDGREERLPDNTQSADSFQRRLDVTGPTRSGSIGEFNAQRLQGEIIRGKIEIAVYEEIANQLENAVWELATLGGGLCGAAVIELVETGWWWNRRRHLVVNGQTKDITDQFNKIQDSNRNATDEQIKDAIIAGAETITTPAGARVLDDAARAAVWQNKNVFIRGQDIEAHLAATEYSDWYHVGAECNGYFDLVDFQSGQTLVSLKSVDTQGKSWLRRMQDHIDDLATRGAQVNDEPATMVLDLRVQPGGAQAAQDLIQYGADNGVTVIVSEF